MKNIVLLNVGPVWAWLVGALIVWVTFSAFTLGSFPYVSLYLMTVAALLVPWSIVRGIVWLVKRSKVEA